MKLGNKAHVLIIWLGLAFMLETKVNPDEQLIAYHLLSIADFVTILHLKFFPSLFSGNQFIICSLTDSSGLSRLF